MIKEVVMAYLKALYQHLHEETEKDHKQPQTAVVSHSSLKRTCLQGCGWG